MAPCVFYPKNTTYRMPGHRGTAASLEEGWLMGWEVAQWDSIFPPQARPSPTPRTASKLKKQKKRRTQEWDSWPLALKRYCLAVMHEYLLACSSGSPWLTILRVAPLSQCPQRPWVLSYRRFLWSRMSRDISEWTLRRISSSAGSQPMSCCSRLQAQGLL